MGAGYILHQQGGFTLDGIVTRLNHICSWYMSYQWEMEALGRDSYSKVVGEEEFLYLHPYPHHIGRLLLNLERSRARGCVSSLSNMYGLVFCGNACAGAQLYLVNNITGPKALLQCVYMTKISECHRAYSVH